MPGRARLPASRDESIESVAERVAMVLALSGLLAIPAAAVPGNGLGAADGMPIAGLGWREAFALGSPMDASSLMELSS